MRKSYVVVDAATNIPLEGRASAELFREAENLASEAHEVNAYCAKGVWYYISSDEVENYQKHLAVPVHLVYLLNKATPNE